MNPLDWSELKTRCRGRLPHWEIPGMTVFLTFRLADSLPQPVIDVYLAERRIIDRLLRQDPDNEELHRERARLFGHHIDRALDSGHGSCALRHPDLAKRVMAVLLNRDRIEYFLHCAVVMPNHGHAVITLNPEVEMEKVTHGWKSPTGHAAVKEFGFSRPFWQSECYDAIVRHAGSLRAVKRYVLDNPRKARLKDWPWVYEAEEDGGWAAGEAPAPP